MPNDINRIVLIGRLTKSPELKSTNGGTYFCRFTLASNHSVKKSDGSYEDKAGFFDCIAWGRSAETLHKYVAKGHRLCVEGALRWSSWENQDGKKQSKVEIGVESFQFLEKRENSQQDAPSAGTYNGPVGDDDIPF